MIPIRHKDCGAILYYYIGESKTLHNQPCKSDEVLKHDGSKIDFGMRMMTICHKCNRIVHRFNLRMNGDVERDTYYANQIKI